MMANSYNDAFKGFDRFDFLSWVDTHLERKKKSDFNLGQSNFIGLLN